MSALYVGLVAACSLLALVPSAQTAARGDADTADARRLEATLTEACTRATASVWKRCWHPILETLLASDYVARGAPDIDRDVAP